MKFARVLMLSLGIALLATSPAPAGTCYVDDPTHINTMPRTSPIQTGINQELPQLCGHEVHGINCVLEVFDNGVGAHGATCLTVGGGVTVEMRDHVIDCPDAAAPCGTAIDLPYSTSATTVESGKVTGCWAKGLDSNAPNAVATDFLVDLQGGANCSGNGDVGVELFKTLTRVVVRNADDIGIVGGAQTTVTDSVVHDCGLGITLLSTGGNATTLDNVLVHHTDVAIQRTDADLTKPTMRDSHVHDSAICTFYRWNDTCGDLSSEVKLLGVNFIDDAITH